MNEATTGRGVREYDVVVVGGGPVGENVAERVRSAGLTAVIVERELLGGECSYWACEPSKALLRPVVARADALRVPACAGRSRGRWTSRPSSPTGTRWPSTGRTRARPTGWTRSRSTSSGATAGSTALGA